MSDYRYLLRRLELKTDSEFGLYIELTDYEHFDYIDDVLTEVFNIEYSFRTQENDEAPCFVYFEEKSLKLDVEKAIDEINEYHKLNKKEYPLTSEG